MTETTQLGLPLLQPAQAQKHVTVNEALMRLDGLVPLVLASRQQSVPPAAPPDGLCHGVPTGAVNGWAGQAGKIAVAVNGGWVFAQPRRGWRAMILDEGAQAVFDGSMWRAGMATLSPANAGLTLRVVETDHVIAPGSQSTTGVIIPANAVVIGATARVTQDISGTLTGWALGNPGAAGRYGSGLGTLAGSWARGVLGQPTTFYTPTAFQLDAEGGDFSGGAVRIAVHFLELELPDL